MRECGVSAFARRALWVALAAVGLIVSAGSLHAQSTGKLEGRIRDQAGAPIAGAQVRVDGTAFGAVANSQGYWFLNSVPAGSVDLTATFVGYKPVRVTGLRVLAGQTITQDFALEQAVVDIGDIEVIGAVNALVPRDEVATKQRIDGAYAEKLPVDRIANVIALQPGVVINNNGGINIRGGRDDEAAVYVDGVPVQGGARGGQFVGQTGGAGVGSVGTNSFEEASVTTGGSSAEFGNAQSGIIAIQTRAGGSKWSGNFGYENDALGGLNHSLGFNRVTGGIGGPIAGNLTFFLSGDLDGAKSQNTGVDRQKSPIFVQAGVDTTVAVFSGTPADTSFVDVRKFAVHTGTCEEFKGAGSASTDTVGVRDIRNNYGLDCRGGQVPYTPTSSYRLQGKLQYTFGTGSRVALTMLQSSAQNRGFNYSNITNPTNSFANWSKNNVATLNWTQSLSKSADRAIALELYASYQWDRAITAPLTRQGEQDTRDPFAGFLIKKPKFLFDFDNFPIAGIAGNFRCNCGAVSPYDVLNPDQYEQTFAYRTNPYGTNGAFQAFAEGGGPSGRLSLYKEDRAIGKGNLDWQVDRYNRLKIGGEYTKYFMNSYSSGLTSQAFSDGYHERPTRWNAFLEDRLDLGDVVLVAGLRYDWYKTGASRPFYTDSATGNRTYFPRISTMPGYDQATEDTLFVADKSHNYLSPHVQVAFPVTERTNFRLSYAHQVQAPDFGVILGGINTDLSITNANQFYGSDLDFGRTITFEFGVRHSFNDDMVLDISAYNKDKLSDAAGRLVSFYDPKDFKNVDVRVMTNADFGNSRGIDIRFDRRIGELFNGSLAYTFEEAKNTGSDPFTYLNFGSRILNAVSGGNSPPPQGVLPTNQSRPHNLSGQLALNFPNNWKQGSAAGSILENVGLFATFRFASGTAFTRCPIDDSSDDNIFAGGAGTGGTCNRSIDGDYNGARLPMFKQFDLRLTKGFALGGMDFTAYSEIRNLFNFVNVTTVFSQTNDIRNDTERTKIRVAELKDFAREATANGVLMADSSINLSFGGAIDPRQSCGSWTEQGGNSATPNCVYLIRAEERYGDGDHIFSQAEQTRASDALYSVFRGLSSFTGAPRRIRVGFEVNF